MKKLLIMIVCAVVGIGVLVTGFNAIFNSDKNVALRAIDGALDGLCARDEVEYFTNLMNGGSVSVNYKNANLDGAEVKASAKLYLELEDSTLMFDEISASVKMGEDKLSLTGSVYADNEKVYVKNDEILGGAYGVEKGTLAEGFKKSVFAPDSGSAMALDEELYETILKALEITEGDLPDKLVKDATDLADDYLTTVRKLIFKHAEYSNVTEEVKIGGEKVSARVISVIITPETIANFLEDFYEYLKEDDDLRDFVVNSYNDFKPVAELFVFSTAAVDTDINVGEIYDEAIEALGEQIDTIVESMKDADEGFVALRLAMPKLSTNLMKAWIVSGSDVKDIEDDPDELMEMMSIDFGEDGAEDTNAITIEYAGQKIKYTVTEEDDVTTYKLSMGSDNSFSLALDDEKKSFTIKANAKAPKYNSLWDVTEYVNAVYVISGDYTTDGDASTFELDHVKVDGEELLTEENKFDFSITFEESDGMPSAEKDIKSVLTMTEEDITKIMEKAMEKFPFRSSATGSPQPAIPNFSEIVPEY